MTAVDCRTDEDELARCRTDLEAAEATIANLTTALSTARQIGCAVGIVMANRKVTSEEAFRLIALSSQHRGQKVRDLASEVILTGALPES